MPSLAELSKSKGENWCLAYVAKWIANMQAFLNVSAKMNDHQVVETALMIVDDFWALNIADINLIFANAKRGQYGQLYGRIDGSIIYRWFQTYFQDRCNACEGRSIREAERSGSDKPVTDAKVAHFVQMLSDKKKTRQQCPSLSE